MNRTTKKFPNNIESMLRRRASTYYRVFQAARCFSDNNRWLNLNSRKPLIVFDFDFIFGALRSLKLLSQLHEQCPIKLPYDPLTVGHNQIRLILRNTNHFVVPPGATLELLKWKQRLRGELMSRNTNITGRFEEIRSSANPVADLMKLCRDTKITSIVRDELEDFEVTAGDFVFLSTILDRSIPFEELHGPPVEGTENAYKNTLLTLKRARPSLSDSNFHDAINVAFVSWMFNRTQTHETSHPDWIPLLVSKTRPLLDLSAHQPLLNLPKAQDLTVIVSEFYMCLSAGLHNFSDGIQGVAELQASRIAAMAVELEQLYRELADNIPTKGNQINDLFDEPAWRLVSYQEQRFRQRWNWLIEDSDEAFQLDLQDDCNVLESRKFEHVLQKLISTNPTKLRSALSNLIMHYRQRCSELGLFDNLLLELSGSEGCKGHVFSTFVLDAQSQGLPLSHLSNGDPISKVKDFDWEKIHSVRIVARFNLSYRAYFAFDSHRYRPTPGRRWIAVVWPYYVPLTSLYDAISLFWSTATEYMPDHSSLVYELFIDGHSVSMNGQKPWYEYISPEIDHSNMFCLRSRNLVVEVDLSPLADVERQIAVLIPAQLTRITFLTEVIKLMKTTKISDIPSDLLLSIFYEIAVHIGICNIDGIPVTLKHP